MLSGFSWEDYKLSSDLSDFAKVHRKKVKKSGHFFRVAVHFNPGHPKPKMINTILCVLACYAFVLQNRNISLTFFNGTNKFFGHSK